MTTNWSGSINTSCNDLPLISFPSNGRSNCWVFGFSAGHFCQLPCNILSEEKPEPRLKKSSRLSLDLCHADLNASSKSRQLQRFVLFKSGPFLISRCELKVKTLFSSIVKMYRDPCRMYRDPTHVFPATELWNNRSHSSKISRNLSPVLSSSYSPARLYPSQNSSHYSWEKLWIYGNDSGRAERYGCGGGALRCGALSFQSSFSCQMEWKLSIGKNLNTLFSPLAVHNYFSWGKQLPIAVVNQYVFRRMSE